MLINVERSARNVLLWVAALVLVAAVALHADRARAGGDFVPVEGSAHSSVLRISAGEQFPQTRAVRIGRNKSLLVELGLDLRDVMVSAPEIVDAVVQSSNRVHLIAKKIGQSNAFFFDANGDQILTLEISVEQDTAVLDMLLARLIPGSNIKSEILNDTIILTGSVRTPIDSNRASDVASRFIVAAAESDERAKNKVVNLLGVEGEEQVMLKVVVAEVQRELLKQFGINLAADINAGNFTWSLLTANALPLTAAAGLGSLPVPGISTTLDEKNTCAGTTCFYNNGPNNTFGNSGTVTSWGNGDYRIGKAMRALERDGLIRTLAEPNLTAISGEPAKFLAGGEFPIPVVDSNGQTSVTFKEFGVGVAFTPTVLSEGRISLKIESEVSELTNVGAVVIDRMQIPALKKRQANSTVELPSGGSIALAGLISDDVRQNIDGFPGLKDIAILGTLFRSRDFIKRETELVVIVTPYLVKPVSQKDLAKPLDGLAEATDRRANFMGHLNRIYGVESAAPVGDLKGDYGFIVE
ncbi:type II and III secretion system protein family protein [Hyphomicrobium sp.]|uniref:type II and III secretion system protein family protein n=1 Tax=Hyphomicrobium sp. TaxID=82 RepID=UPI002E32FA0E|nr:type II and III secretion system protein family protein [Hyphomicrobium sp.]HEX2841929.1 type II and III secretion system protein family protein [Hyphomicrobium sp.]